MRSLEVQMNQAIDQLKEKDKLIISLKKVIHQKQITIATIQRDWLLKEAKLPADAVERLHGAFATSTDNAGLKQAINTERKKVSQ